MFGFCLLYHFVIFCEMSEFTEQILIQRLLYVTFINYILPCHSHDV